MPRWNRALGVVVAAGMLVGVSGALAMAQGMGGGGGSMMQPLGPQMALATILSPSEGGTVAPTGWDLQVQILVPARYAAMVPATPALIPPTSPFFKPGPNHAFPGLVVTDTGTAAKLGGPARNLAGLFQVVGVEKDLSGDTVIEADWLVGKPLFGAVRDTCVRAFVVSGTAPAMIPSEPTNQQIGGKVAGHTLLSNVAKVDFTTLSAAPASTSM